MASWDMPVHAVVMCIVSPHAVQKKVASRLPIVLVQVLQFSIEERGGVSAQSRNSKVVHLRIHWV